MTSRHCQVFVSPRMQFANTGCHIARLEEESYSLVVVSLAVEFTVTGVTSLGQDDATYAALKTRFMPRVIHDSHDVSIADSLTTSNTDLHAANASTDSLAIDFRDSH